MTHLRILYKGGDVSIYAPLTYEQVCTWTEKGTPDSICKEALKSGSLFFRDYQNFAQVHYLSDEPTVVVKFWEGEDENPCSKLKIRYFRTTPQQADGAFARKFLPKAAKPRIF